MQQAAGLDVRWVSAKEATGLAPQLSGKGFVGASYAPTDGFIDPPRNVRAYVLAMQSAGVELRERTAFVGLRLETAGGGRRVVGVETSGGVIETPRVILTGGPSLAEIGRLAGLRIPVGGARHTVAVSEPHDAFAVDRMPMVFDIAVGLYWRLEEGGLLFGWSNPDEPPGEARQIDWPWYERMRDRLAELLPVTGDLGLRKIWAATIDYVEDHLPILGPGLTAHGEPIEGVTVATASGHGMMFGPGVARVAADLALRGRTEVCDVSSFGLDRFDAEGRSRVAGDPIALPFPREVPGEAATVR
jgi:sarcosine oxidase subunit beta